MWTDQVRDRPPRRGSGKELVARAPAELDAATSDGEHADPATEPMDPDALWQVRGRPMTGIAPGRYKITNRYLYFESGALRTDAQQVPISNVVDVDVRQSATQKYRKVADILVHVAGPRGTQTVKMADVPNFREGLQLINDAVHEARLKAEKRAATTRHEYVHDHGTGQPSAYDAGKVAPSTAGNDAEDPLVRLERLGELRGKGLLTDDEFAEMKAQILSQM